MLETGYKREDRIEESSPLVIMNPRKKCRGIV
jgi:hypothetical protein